MDIINVGYNNLVVAQRIIAIVAYNSSPIKKLKDSIKKQSMVIDATCGRKTRSVIITDSNHLILSSLHPETLLPKIQKLASKRK